MPDFATLMSFATVTVSTLKAALDIVGSLIKRSKDDESSKELEALYDNLQENIKAIESEMRKIPEFPPQTEVLLPSLLILYLEHELDDEEIEEIIEVLDEFNGRTDTLSEEFNCESNIISFYTGDDETYSKDEFDENLTDPVIELLKEHKITVRAVTYK